MPRLLTGLPNPREYGADPRENGRAITHGEFRKAQEEEPWRWHGERCECGPCSYWRNKQTQ